MGRITWKRRIFLARQSKHIYIYICFSICNNGPSNINVGTIMPAITHSHGLEELWLYQELCPITSTVIHPLFLKPSLLKKVRREVKRAVELSNFFRFGINSLFGIFCSLKHYIIF